MTSVQALAAERIAQLFAQAEASFARHPERADRYVRLARKIGMRHNVRLARYRLSYCRGCGRFLKLGVNARARTRSDKRVVFTCLGCGWVRRYRYAGANKNKRI